MRYRQVAGLWGASAALAWAFTSPSLAAGQLVIAASPTVSGPIEALSRQFEQTHPTVQVKIYYNSGLALRQTVATIENRGGYFRDTGPIHLLAPGGDELIARLQHKHYVLPGTAVPYASVPLVLVVPEALVEAPASFDALLHQANLRVAMADPELTTLGQQTMQLLRAVGFAGSLGKRFDVASDAASVLDHLLHGKADVAIVYGPDAVREREHVRIVATASDQLSAPTVHSIATLRSCPDRPLCEQFLEFVRTADAQAVIARLGYQPVSATR